MHIENKCSSWGCILAGPCTLAHRLFSSLKCARKDVWVAADREPQQVLTLISAKLLQLWRAQLLLCVGADFDTEQHKHYAAEEIFPKAQSGT